MMKSEKNHTENFEIKNSFFKFQDEQETNHDKREEPPHSCYHAG